MKFMLQRLWHRAFQVGIVIKGFDGALEVAGGSALLLTTQPAIQRCIVLLTHGELVENPHDFLANLIGKTAQHLSIDTQHFAGAYLVGHGIIKIGLAIGLLRGLLWSYPVALLFLTVFIIYQLYRLFHTQSITLSLLTAFDFAIVLLIWREWRHAKTCRGLTLR
jgi:uncharacterized membrane protein